MGRRLAEKMSIFPGDTVLVASFENIRTGPWVTWSRPCGISR
jgi:hypothetical protein